MNVNPWVQDGFARLDARDVKAAAGLASATLHEAAGRIGALPSAIKPVAPLMRVAGTALTVQSPGGDNLWFHRALEVALPGDVLVVNVSDAHEYGYWGEVMATAAQVRGLAGLVIDGCVRDADLLEQMAFAVFSRGLCIRGTGKDHGAKGFVGHPILMGEIVVNSGDLIVGDRDGVVAIPAGRVTEVIGAAREREIKETDIQRRLRLGELTMDIYGFRK